MPLKVLMVNATGFNEYTKEWHSLSLCWTNQAVDANKQPWNTPYVHGKQVEVDGCKQSKYMLHAGFKCMVYRSNGTRYYISEHCVVKQFDGTYMCLFNDVANSEHNLVLTFTDHFKPLYAMTFRKAPGMTINRPYIIYEYSRMQHDMLHAAVTRTSKTDYASFCDINSLKLCVVYIYRSSYNGQSYNGSTTEDKRRT